MSYYIREGVDLKEVPMHKVETLMNAGITIISDKDIIQQLKQQLEEAVEVIDVLIQDIETPSRLGLADKPNENWESLNKARQFLAKYRGENGN